MKRLGATRTATSRRKRTNANETAVAARPSGRLTEDEIEKLRQAYVDGARGSILIGLRGEDRLITQMLPPQPDVDSATRRVERNAAELKKIGCDGYVYIRPARLTGEKTITPQIGMIVETSIEGRRQNGTFIKYLGGAQILRGLSVQDSVIDALMNGLKAT